MLALAVATDGQWDALCSVLGDPAWAREPALASAAGRRAAHDVGAGAPVEGQVLHVDLGRLARGVQLHLVTRLAEHGLPGVVA